MHNRVQHAFLAHARAVADCSARKAYDAQAIKDFVRQHYVRTAFDTDPFICALPLDQWAYEQTEPVVQQPSYPSYEEIEAKLLNKIDLPALAEQIAPLLQRNLTNPAGNTITEEEYQAMISASPLLSSLLARLTPEQLAEPAPVYSLGSTSAENILASFTVPNAGWVKNAPQAGAELGKQINKGVTAVKEGASAVGSAISETAKGITNAIDNVTSLPKYVILGVVAIIVALIFAMSRVGSAMHGQGGSIANLTGKIDLNSVMALAPQTRGLAAASALARDARVVHDASCVCDACSTQSGFSRSGGATAHDFYVTPSSRSSIVPLPPGEYGRTYLDERPFRIEITSEAVPERQRLALVHELLHVYDETHKLGISHSELHGLAYYILSEVMPGVASFNETV